VLLDQLSNLSMSVPLIKTCFQVGASEAFKHLHVGMISHQARHYQRLQNIGLEQEQSLISHKISLESESPEKAKVRFGFAGFERQKNLLNY